MRNVSVLRGIKARLGSFRSANDNPQFIVFSFPKSGTHFVKSFFRTLTGETIGHDHVHHYRNFSVEKLMSDKYKSTKLIFPYRDPRDALVSYVFWVDKLIARGDPMASTYGHPEWQKWSTERKLLAVIGGVEQPTMLKNIEVLPELVDSFTQNPQVCVVRFEDFIGAEGGGDTTRQIEVMGDLAQFILGRRLDEHELKSALGRSWGQDATFNDPKIGRWREHFTPPVTAAFKASAWNQALIQLGYDQW